MDRRALVLASLLALSSSLALAQDPPDAGAANTTPTFSGRDRASGAVSFEHGAVFELGNGAKLFIPAGNRISRSHVMIFSNARQAPRPANVAQGFMRQGPTMNFDAAIDASTAPVEVSVRMRTAPHRPHMKLVLAVEEPGICDATHTERITGPLCSHWRLLDAEFADGRLVAHLSSPGGFRLQFGLAPEPDDSANDTHGIP